MEKYIIGWDIGGAHVKAACLNPAAEVLHVTQLACPLWKGIGYLHSAVASYLLTLPAGSYSHFITMTGELADCFNSRVEGVDTIIRVMQQHLSQQQIWIYASQFGFLSPAEIQPSHYMAIASVNWLASAELAAKACQFGLFVDTGSTTTDIVLIENQQLQVKGYSDYQRLVSGELLYTGVIRSAVMAVAQQAEFNGQNMGLMTEYFATMADVYRVCGDLDEAHDQADTADGAEKTLQASARRLSRLTGYEFSQSDWPLWQAFALTLKNRQKQLIWQSCAQQLQRSSQTGVAELCGAGVGRFLLQEIAAEQGLIYRDFNQLFKSPALSAQIDAGDCAPAVAVAYLGGQFC
ncbi:H4MPT-linked C1 transfer pathway protein [Methylomonas paludis]|uniref:H4MPT-linked C1 transfer pathway protein n=1 Tax=Methylomonas paludis TaxID=1173101 RepID=A0A975R841_9GAMM|nr:hydantoinase/oxoprolinase family protein [Methylomonas paludis]QWF69965.1 H4MPT-linked C1 transfer pathway protein [Methylomonas paludis]